MEKQSKQEIQEELQELVDYYQLSSPLPDDVRKEILDMKQTEEKLLKIFERIGEDSLSTKIIVKLLFMKDRFVNLIKF